MKRIDLVLWLIALIAIRASVTAQPLAFPGAVGFGKNVTGGRNGTVYHVTNLNDAGAGSFRDAVSQPNRIIVFDVSGYITLKTAVSAKGNLTIAGQTAPGEGIGFRGGKISFGNQSNIIIRHIRIRPGSEVASDEDVGINLLNAKDVIVDHCSIEFAPWNNIGGVSTDWQTKPVENITFQNCLIANPTYQQFGAHIECPNGTWTWAYNIFANSHNRNPLDKINDIFINNVLYNCSAGYTTHTSTKFKHDIINNYFVKGPASTGTDNQWYQVDKNQSIYYSGNIKDGTLDGVLNGSGTTPYWYQGPGTILTAPWSAETANIPTYSAATAFRYTSSFAGTFPYDEMDRLIISQVRTVAGGTTGYTAGTRGPAGGLYTTQTQTGLGNNGYGTIVAGTRATDTDNDGMPDFWEKSFGLNITSNDAMTKGSDGYANIEKYINWLAEPRIQTNQNTAVTIDLSTYTGGFTKVSPVHSIVSASNGTAVLASNGTTASFTPASNFSGMGSFKFKVKGSDGTEFTFTVSVVVIPTGAPCTAPAATLTAAGSTTFCQGNNVVLNANTGSGLTYQWKNGTTVISGTTASSYTATASGSYSVVVTNASNCSATSAAVGVTATALPTATITAAAGTIIPYGGSLTLTAATGTGYIYQWKKSGADISGATTASYNVNAAGAYTVTVTSGNCSATSAVITVTSETPPSKYVYTYDNSGNLSWSNTNSWTPKAVPRAIDTVIIRTGEVQINALTHTAPVYVETNGILRLVTANSTIDKLFMQGGTLKVFTSTPELTLTSNITVQQPSTIMAGSVAATIFTLNGTITGNANLTKTSVGILRISSTATGFKGNWIVTEGKLQLRTATGLGVCGALVKAAARLDIETAGASIYSLVVEENGGVDLDQNLNVSVAVFGASNMLTGAHKNADYPAYIGSTGTLNVLNSLVTASGATTFCAGGSVTLTSSSGTSYSWKNNTTQTATTAAYTVNAAGSYNVTFTNSNGCKITSAAVVITIAAAQATPTITTPATSFCTGGSATLTASAGASYKWFKSTDQVGTNASYTATAAGSYTVEVTNANGCKATSAPTTITISPAPVWYEDTDGDGKGNTAVTQTSCTQPAGYVSAAGDACPADPNKTEAGVCGCGNTETDTDSDGTPDCADTDDDNDGTTDANDCAPLNAAIGAAAVWYEDADGDGKGNTTIVQTACTQPAGYVSVDGDDCPDDAAKTAPGNCGCNNSETACLDCAGTPNGTAFLDNCSICVGGTTGNTACVSTTTRNGTSANIQVIPQPFDAGTSISVDNLGMIQAFTIINASGTLVETKQDLNTTEITIGESLAAGLYTVILTTEQGTYTTKIVKK